MFRKSAELPCLEGPATRHAVGAVGGRSTGGLVGLWYFCFQRGAFRRPLSSDVSRDGYKVVVRAVDFSTPFFRT